MNAPNTALVAKTQTTALSVMTEPELMDVLRNSLYPGAKDESIKLVIGYCKAAGLDPMQKPVHIVPMSVSTGKKDNNGWDIKEMRDVVMPGIGLYRTQASRTGECAGITEPEFGEDVTKTLGETTITFPKWCKVTVKRLLPNGSIVEFTAKELWIENYASKSNKVSDPNSMWKKRPYAQLAKCAEAQALRKAFPELGAAPTADEMEGKTLDDQAIEGSATVVKEIKPVIPPLSAEEFDKQKGKWKAAAELGKKTPEAIIAWVTAQNIALLTDDQKKEINSWKKLQAEPPAESAAIDTMPSQLFTDVFRNIISESDIPF